MQVLFVTDFSPIVTDADASRQFYINGLELPLTGEPPRSEQLEGVKHFGLWPLSEAARACFGTDTWPGHLSIPQANLEFEVADVAAAASELEAKGLALLHPARVEPWGQTIARLLSPDGLIIGICWTPWLHAVGHEHAKGAGDIPGVE
jgi:catechol 2,3-dioxygenase-like lactoylglutathione lyase family enzyme